MTDAQFGMLLGVLGTLGTALIATFRWAVNRVTKSMDDSTAERSKHTEELIRVREKVNHIHDWVTRREEYEAQLAQEKLTKLQANQREPEDDSHHPTPLQGVPIVQTPSRPYNPLTTPRSTPVIREHPRKGTKNDDGR